MVMNRSQIGGSIITPGSRRGNAIGGKVYTPAATYPSSSNAGKSYTVCEVDDGTISCDCKGWTQRNPPGGRTCKHTQDYEALLRPLWNNLQTQPQGPPVWQSSQGLPARDPAPAVQATDREKGGTLADLFAKLEKGGLGT